MEEIIQQIRTAGLELRPGLTEAELTAFQRDLGAQLPVDLSSLYADHDGMLRAPELPMRMLTHVESVRDTAAVRAQTDGLLDATAALFWSDDNSNYAGVYLDGLLANRVFLLEGTDAPDLSSSGQLARAERRRLHAIAQEARDQSRLAANLQVVSVGTPSARMSARVANCTGFVTPWAWRAARKNRCLYFKVGSPLPRCATRRHGTRARCCGHPACPNRARTRIRQARTGSRRVAAARSGHRSFVEPARPSEWAQGSRRGPGDPATRSRRCTRRRQGRARGWVAR